MKYSEKEINAYYTALEILKLENKLATIENVMETVDMLLGYKIEKACTYYVTMMMLG